MKANWFVPIVKEEAPFIFYSTEGALLRLSVQGHPRQGDVLYCALCGQNAGPGRRHTSSYSCQICAVHLCVTTYAGLRKISFSI